MHDRLAVLFAFLIGIIPSYGLLFLITMRYETKIMERDTMMTFVIGLFAGIVVVIGHLYFIVSGDVSLLIISSFLLALAELLLYHIYLKRRKFKERGDLPFIATAFALGISAMFIVFVSGQMLIKYDDLLMDSLLGMFVFSISISLMRSAMAILLSRGELRGSILIPAFIGTIVFGLFNLISFLYLAFDFLWTFSIGTLILALTCFLFNIRFLETVPDIPPEERDDHGKR